MTKSVHLPSVAPRSSAGTRVDVRYNPHDFGKESLPISRRHQQFMSFLAAAAHVAFALALLVEVALLLTITLHFVVALDPCGGHISRYTQNLLKTSCT